MNPYELAVDYELINAQLGVADETDSYEMACRKVSELIQWNIEMALDPDVNGMWKFVDQEVPENDRLVLTVNWAGSYNIDYYDINNKRWGKSNGVKYWTELPKAPKDVRELKF